MRRVFAILVLLAGVLAAPASAWAQAAPACQFILGFNTLDTLDAADIGTCVDNQAFAPNGDAQQHTTNGLLAWRKLDNWTAFTNGYWTWINGPNGLAQRLNTQRFSWEANPDGLPLADAAAVQGQAWLDVLGHFGAVDNLVQQASQQVDAGTLSVPAAAVVFGRIDAEAQTVVQEMAVLPPMAGVSPALWGTFVASINDWAQAVHGFAQAFSDNNNSELSVAIQQYRLGSAQATYVGARLGSCTKQHLVPCS